MNIQLYVNLKVSVRKIDEKLMLAKMRNFVCLCVIKCVCQNCGTLCYSFSFGNQTDKGDETEGLEREG